MHCLNCKEDKFEERKLRVTPEVKGEEVEVVVSAFVCVNCNTPLMDLEQMGHLRKAAADQYRKNHNLLTSEEIVKFRSMLGMSQVAFANYLKVGEASIKRWETYFVQEEVQDEHIRLKCDEAYAEFNALNVHWKCHAPDIYSGNRRFSWELFKQCARFLVTVLKSPLFLNKGFFYADFKHFERYKTSITGARYVHLEYGPCPDQYQNLSQRLIQEGVLLSAGNHLLKSGQEPNMDVFDDSEKAILKLIVDLAKLDGGQKLLKMSHQEAAYKKTEPLELISYDHAKSLKI